jgi:hypothetical protein
MSKQKMKTETKTIQPMADQPNSIEKPALSVEELAAMLQQAQQAKISQLTETIRNLADENNLSVGVSLDIQKITDILHFMLTNNKPVVNLQFEVWNQ